VTPDTEQTIGKNGPDPGLKRFREFVAATIAVIVVAGTVLLMIAAFSHVRSPEVFGRVKDLLLIINPILGVVIGYYFNKVSTEARAENAEATARTAAVTAQQATEARNTAENETRTVKAQVQETRSALQEVSQAAEGMLAQMPRPGPAVGTLAPGGAAGPSEETWLNLKGAVMRAKRIYE